MGDSAARASKVSVVIPAYNAARFIEKALASVCAQTRPADEIIVVDDVSGDDTVACLEPWVRDGRVVLVRHAANTGPGGARNSGVERATGDVVAFLDADDEWFPNHLALGAAALEAHPELDAVLLNSDVVDLGTGARAGTWFDVRRAALAALETTRFDDGFQRIDGRLLETLLGHFFVHLQTMIGRTRLFRNVRFDENLRRSEDLDWCVRAVHDEGMRLAWSEAVTGVYVRHDSSLTTHNDGNREYVSRAEHALYRRYLEWSDLGAGERAVARRHIRDCALAMSYFERRRGNLREALRHLSDSLRYGFVPDRQLVEAGKIAVSGLRRS